MADTILNALSGDMMVRLVVADTRELVEQARAYHNCSATASALLGRLLTAASIMGSDLKDPNFSVTLRVDGDGPAGYAIAVADGDGFCRGCMMNPDVDLPLKENGKLNVGGAVGQGSLTVVKDMKLKEPYVGKIELVSGEIAEDITEYLYYSEQTPGVCSLGVLVDTDGTIAAAGGFILSLMPGADEEVISGETLIDFSKPVIFTVKSRIEYRFKVEVIYSGLPVVFIETPGGKQIPSKWEDWLSGSKVTIYNPDWTIDYEGDTGVRGRGNSTWSYPKKPYALKLDSKAEILGMPKHKRWVLLANWMDRTLMRNSVSFELASRSGLAYTPRGQFVELFVNGKHSGNYFLCEHIKVDENRVDIDELDEDEVDGGYIMELDAYFDEVFKFRSPVRDLPYMFKDPDEVNDAQFEFMKNYISELEYALYDDQRFAEGEYLNYIDVESFADWWIVMELTGIWEPNHPKSTYMHKDKGGKLVMGPVWDFDWETYTPKTWFSINESLYYKRLFQDPRFVDVVKQRWDMYKADYETLPEYIRSEAAKIRNSDRMDSPMWPITQWVNGDENMTFDDAVKRMVKVYEDRFDWMDAAIGRM